MCAFHFGMIKILHLCWWPKVPWKLSKVSACRLPGARDRQVPGLGFEDLLLLQDLASQHFQVESLPSLVLYLPEPRNLSHFALLELTCEAVCPLHGLLRM